ncbi:MAG: response regulator transcription factor [Caldilineaceae bacterium]|nr:response regulator transcription factor [Caldilineaceae bacterium]
MAGVKILVVDDEPSISEVVKLYLVREGFDATVVDDGRSALELLESDPPDLLILDVMLPGVDGYEITRQVRATSSIPIILLTARKDEIDRILGLELGADDYVVKPFSTRELVSRVKAVLRRTQQALAPPGGDSPITSGSIHIDPRTRQVTVAGNEIPLTVKEFDLLWMFTSNPNQVFNRDQLLDQVWGVSEFIDASTVTVHVRRLREKIELDPSNPRHIITVWGVGYRFEPGEHEVTSG